MKNKKVAIIDKSDTMICWRCDGSKTISVQSHDQQCPICNGSGKWIEKHYLIIDNKNKIAIDSDSGG